MSKSIIIPVVDAALELDDPRNQAARRAALACRVERDGLSAVQQVADTVYVLTVVPGRVAGLTYQLVVTADHTYDTRSPIGRVRVAELLGGLQPAQPVQVREPEAHDDEPRADVLTSVLAGVATAAHVAANGGGRKRAEQAVLRLISRSVGVRRVSQIPSVVPWYVALWAAIDGRFDWPGRRACYALASI